MANAEFEQLNSLAQEIRQGKVYPLGETGFYNTDQYEGLLREHGFLTHREEELIDRANARIHRSTNDYERSLEVYTRHVLRQNNTLPTPRAIVQKKEILRPNFPRAKYEKAMPWLNWYKGIEPFMLQSQIPKDIADLGEWIITADKSSRGLIITQPHEDGKETSIFAPSFRGSNDHKPFPVFCLRSSRIESLDGIVRASYAELWYILLENLLFPPNQSNIQKAIERFIEKRQASNAA